MALALLTSRASWIGTPTLQEHDGPPQEVLIPTQFIPETFLAALEVGRELHNIGYYNIYY